jgi:hypothetical protein
MSEPGATCCGSDLAELANADRHGHSERIHRVTVYQCKNCMRIIALGESADPGWVGAKVRMFLDLRKEAFELAGLTASPAVAIFDTRKRRVIFG